MTDQLVYERTVKRLEPNIHHMDTSACLPSIAISLKRIADKLDTIDPAAMASVLDKLDFSAVNSALERFARKGFMGL